MPALGLVVSTVPATSPSRAPVRFAWFRYEGHDPARPRAGAGEFVNPILPGFYPDPSVIRVGRDYFLANSTFAYFPGLPIFSSRDLVHWRQVGNAVDRPGQLDFGGRGLSEGVFAPALHHAGGRFFLVDTCIGCGGTFVLTARDPAGPWSDPSWIRDVGGIDPSFFTDADGTTWLLNDDAPAGGALYDGHRAIWIRRFDLAAMRTTGPARQIVDGGIDRAAKPIWAEGPHLLRRGRRYYLLTAEGGTGSDHAEVAYRADRPDGPFMPVPHPILTQRDMPPERPDPITSAGHAQLVETPGGQWWAAFLATRPYRGDLYATGRETFLARVRWRGGWPVVTRPGETIARVARRPALPPSRPGPVPLSGDFTLRDDFQRRRLASYWMVVRTPRERWWDTGATGLAIVPRAEPIGGRGQPSFVARRLQHQDAQASTRLDASALPVGGKAGLVAYQNEAHYYFVGLVVEAGRRLVRVERRTGEADPVDGAVLAARMLPPGLADAPLRLRIVVRGGRCAFDYAVAGAGWTRLLDDADAAVLSTARAGGFVGTMIGPYAYAPPLRSSLSS